MDSSAINRRVLRWALGAATALLLPLVHPNPYHLDVLTTALLYALLALGLNLIVGMTGLLHLGYAAFFAIGAYTYGLLNLHWSWPFWAGWMPAAAAAGCCGVGLGIPALRVRGDYLAIVTLGFGEIVRIAFTNLTAGPEGRTASWASRTRRCGCRVRGGSTLAWPRRRTTCWPASRRRSWPDSASG